MKLYDATPADFTRDKIHTILEKGNWCIITAENPNGEAYPQDINRIANADLVNMLNSLKLEYIPVTGHYAGNEEHSFIVLGASRIVAEELRDCYNQESVLIPRGLLYNHSVILPAMGVIVHRDPPADNYSILPDGTCFTINIKF